MLASASLLLVANMSVEPIVTLYVGQIARPGDDVVLYAGAAMSAAAFAAMLAAPTIGRLADRSRPLAGRRLQLRRGRRLLIPQAFVAAPWQLVALRFLMGLSLSRADAGDHGADPSQRAGRGDRPDPRIFAIGAIFWADRRPVRRRGGRRFVRHARSVPRHRGRHARGGRGQRGDAAAGGE